MTDRETIVEERRAHARQHVGADVLIEGRMFLTGDTSLPCRIVSLSREGAGLRFEQGDMLPARFALRIASFDRLHECEVAWWKQGEVGVRFLDADPGAA